MMKWYLFMWKRTQQGLFATLRWRHNDYAGVSNHQPHGCLLNRLFKRKSKKTSKLRVTGLCVGNSPGTGEFPAQKASYAENVSIWWRHHDMGYPCEAHLKLKSREVSFAHKCITYYSITRSFYESLYRTRQSHCRVLCKISKWLAEWNGGYGRTSWDERDFARFEFKMNFGRISYIVNVECFGLKWNKWKYPAKHLNRWFIRYKVDIVTYK